VETQLEVIVSHENITIHNDFVHMAANLNYTVVHVEIYQKVVHGHE
jgi:hypothetical protein